MLTTCLICNRRRVETVCGDQSCPCRADESKWADTRPIVIEGLECVDKRGRTVRQAKCGRWIVVDTKEAKRGR